MLLYTANGLFQGLRLIFILDLGSNVLKSVNDILVFIHSVGNTVHDILVFIHSMGDTFHVPVYIQMHFHQFKSDVKLHFSLAIFSSESLFHSTWIEINVTFLVAN